MPIAPEGQKDERQALTPLPLVDGLGFLKAEKLLEIPNGQALCLPQPADIGPCSGKVNNGELVEVHKIASILTVVKRQRWLKRASSKKVRACSCLPGKGNGYRKVFDYWWELY